MPVVTRHHTKMSAESFQQEYCNLKATALAYFPNDEDKDAREMFISDARQDMLRKYNLLSKSNNSASTSVVNSRPRNIVKDFLLMCPKFNSSNESIIDFFDRFENALKRESVSDDKHVQLLEALIPVNLFTPFERHLAEKEQYETYKKRALRNSRCTHIDMIYKCCNSKFESHDSFTKIYENIRNNIIKTNDLVTGSRISDEHVELFTKIMIVCRLPRSVQKEISDVVRPENLDEFSLHFERFATSRNRTVGSYFTETKPMPTRVQFENPKNYNLKPTSENNSSKTINLCKHCAKPGHSADKCYTKFPEKRPKTTSQVDEGKSDSTIRHIVIKDTFKASHNSSSEKQDLTAGPPAPAAPSSGGSKHRGLAVRHVATTGAAQWDSNFVLSSPTVPSSGGVYRRVSAIRRHDLSVTCPSASAAPSAGKCLDSALTPYITGAVHEESTDVPVSPAVSSSGRHLQFSAVPGAPHSTDNQHSVAPRAFIAAAKNHCDEAVSCAPVSADKCYTAAPRAPTSAGITSSAVLTTLVTSTLQLLVFIVLQAIVFTIRQPLKSQLLQLIALPLLQVLVLIILQVLGALRLDLLIILPVFLLWMILFLSKCLIPRIMTDQRAWSSCRYKQKST